MKYLGNKTRLIDFIKSSLIKHNINISNKKVIDLCAGTGAVTKMFKTENCDVSSVDIMNYSFYELYRTVYFNVEPTFDEIESTIGGNKLSDVINYLNKLEGYEGYYFNEYADGGLAQRRYFSSDNGKKIDALMDKTKEWEDVLPLDKINFIKGLIINSIDRVSNIAGTYGAFLKIWRSMALKKIEFIIPSFIEKGTSSIVKDDIVSFLKANKEKVDIVYMDPPYNERQYAPNFHVLENLSNNNKPDLIGKTGIINYDNQKSMFCYKKSALNELDNVVTNLNTDTFVLSYSTEGIMEQDKIFELLSKYFKNVYVEKNKYRRFKTNSNTKADTGLCELLFIATNQN